MIHKAVKSFLRLVLIAQCLVSTSQAMADEWLGKWHLFGSNTARVSFYDSYGPGAASPYPFEGGMLFDEFNLYFERELNRFDRYYGEISGVANVDDGYRALDNGLVPERLNITRVNGDTGIPYRVELGDVFSYYSYLTLQRSLKGAQLELQPLPSTNSRRHSIVMSLGATESNWRDLTMQDNFSTGLSWLVQDDALGALSLNAVHNYRDNSRKLGTLDRSQAVFSVAAEKAFSLFQHALNLDLEIAHFTGDHDGVGGAARGQDRSENGYYLAVGGRDPSRRLDYRLRFDHYGQDFRPHGAIVTADRRSAETHIGWRFTNGIRLRGRAQLFDDGFESRNRIRTRTYGMNLAGPLFPSLLTYASGSLDAYVQLRDDELRTLDTRTQSVNLNLTSPLTHGWLGRVNLYFQNVTDGTAARAHAYTREVSLSADHAISFANFDGVITPGLTVRTVRKGFNHTTDIRPRVAMSLRNGPHAFRIDYGSRLQNRKLSISGADIDTHTANFDYRYDTGRHIFGFEGNLFGRDPDPGRSTEAYRLSVYWTVQFDRPPTDSAVRTSTTAASVADAYGLGLIYLAPGTGQFVVEQQLRGAGLGEGTRFGTLRVYEFPILDNVFERQRYVVDVVDGVLTRTALVIDFDDVGNRDTVAQTFERTRESLIRELGRPTRTYENGEFGPSIVDDVNAQRLTRIVEWDTPSGLIRFGIPRRLDSQVRMEVQYARHFPPARETLWSIEAIR